MIMRRIIKIVLGVFVFLVLSSQAYSQNNEYYEIINYFEVSSNIATPVTIKTSKGTYKIYGGERIDGNLYSVTAYDAYGNKIVQNTPYKTSSGTSQPTIRYYRFTSVYSSQQSNSYNSSSESNYGSSFGSRMADYASRAAQISMDGYPNLQIRAGWSLHFGEMLTAKAELGGVGGYVIAGGVGKNYFMDDEPVEKLSWYVETGFYGGDENNDISFNVILGRNQLASKLLIGADLEYSHFLEDYPRIGFYIAGQWGVYWETDMGSFKDFFTKAAWDIRVGVSWKLFSS